MLFILQNSCIRVMEETLASYHQFNMQWLPLFFLLKTSGSDSKEKSTRQDKASIIMVSQIRSLNQ